MNQNTLESSPSPTRRKLLTGLVAASAVSAMAPQQWTQPVLKRMITPAHGQALSIAAGTYTGNFSFPITDLGCSLSLDIEYVWPGGTEETEVLGTLTYAGPIEASVGACSAVTLTVGDTEPFTGLIFVASSSFSGDGVIAISNTNPPLPAGFSFFLRLP